MTSSPGQSPQHHPAHVIQPVHVHVTNRGCLSSLLGASAGVVLGVIVLVVFAVGGCLFVGLLFRTAPPSSSSPPPTPSSSPSTPPRLHP